MLRDMPFYDSQRSCSVKRAMELSGLSCIPAALILHEC